MLGQYRCKNFIKVDSFYLLPILERTVIMCSIAIGVEGYRYVVLYYVIFVYVIKYATYFVGIYINMNTYFLAISILIPILQCIPVHSSQTCFEDICIPENYDKLIRPLLNATNDILVDISKLKILKVDDFECTIKLSLWFYLTWSEPRLILPSILPPYVWLDNSFWEKLWKPDVYFFNLKEIIMKHAFFHESDSFFLINSNNLDTKVRYSGEFELIIYCKMAFDTYPLDQHVCDLKLGSSKMDSSKINFTLSSLSFSEDEQVSLLDYVPEVQSLPDFKRLWTEHGHLTWYCTGFQMKLVRKFTKYIINYYIPSGLLVIVSWVRIFLSLY